METQTPAFPVALRALARSRIARAAVAMVLVSLPIVAVAAGPVTVKGKTVGAGKLLNPGWNEAKNPKLNRYTFREPSVSVRSDVHTLTAFLPKELCVAALVDGEGKAFREPRRVVIAGGRTSPVMLVVAPGQQIYFENLDAFPHKLYVVGADSKGFAATETAKDKGRSWTPPGPGKYEIRDQMSPSVRSWIVVEPHLFNVGYPDRKGDFQIDLEPGSYKLRGYVNGEPVGVELPITITPVPVEQPLRLPLVVSDIEAPPPVPGKLAPKGPPGKAPPAGQGG